MALAPQSRLVSLEEFLSWPEESPALELIDGVVEQKPVGNFDHAAAVENLYRALMAHSATAEGRAMSELGKSYAAGRQANHRVPDLSYFLSRDIPLDPRRYPAVPPDLAAEVRSPGQSRAALESRLQFLLDHGTKVGLLVDPSRKTVTVFEAGEDPRTYTADDELALDALNGFSLKVSTLFE